MRPIRDVISSLLWTFFPLFPALALAQSQSQSPGPGPGPGAGGAPAAQGSGNLSPVWWVILAIFAVVLIWAVIRAQRRSGAAGGH